MTTPIILLAPVYEVSFEATAITAAGFLGEFRAAAAEGFTLLELEMSSDRNADEKLGVRIGRYGTAGTGGGAVTEEPMHPNFAASLIEVVSEPTGAPAIQTGWKYEKDWHIKTTLVLPRPSKPVVDDSIAIELLDVPGASSNFYITARYHELGLTS